MKSESVCRSHARWFAALGATLLTLSACDAFRDADQRTARAGQMAARHEYREAVIELKNALQDEPDHVPARVKLAEIELHLGDAVSAEKDLRKAITAGAPLPANAELSARIDLAVGQSRDLLARIDSGELPLAGSARALYRGQALLEQRDYAAARAELETIAVADPRHAAARIGVADALAGEGKVNLALQELDRLVVADPKLFSAWLARGTLRAKRGEFAAAAGDLQSARALLSPAVEAAPRVRLLASLCEVLLAQSDAKGAAEVLQELAALSPGSIVTQILAARIALANQDYATATAGLQRALTAAPDLMPIRFLLGVSLTAQGNLGQAEQQLSQVVQRAPEILEARKLLAQVRLRLGRPEAAVQLLSGAQGGDDPQFDVLLGVAQLQLGDESAGVAHLERAAAASPDNVPVRLDLATAYLRADRADDAVKLLSKLDRARADARQTGLLVAALEASGDRRGAQSEVDRLLAAQPRDLTVLDFAAQYAAYRRDFAKAREINQRAIAADAKSVMPLLSRARVEAQSGDMAAAEQWLTKAIAVDPGNAPAHLALAQLAAQRGDRAAATRTLEDLRQHDPAAVQARLQLLGIYLRGSDAAAARPVIDELGKLGETRPEVLNALGRLFLDNGRYDEALLRFQAATALDEANPVYWLNMARTQISQGNAGVARESLDKSLAARADFIPAVGTLAMLDVKEGHAPAAVSRVGELVKSHPRDDAALTLQGDVFMVTHDYVKAATAYAAAAALRPSSALAAKTFSARQQGKLANATEPLEKWLAAHPADNALRMLLANSYQDAGDGARAAKEYEFIDARGAASPITLNNLAWLYYELKDARAETVARRAYDAAPQLAAISDTYGWILVENGKALQAVDVLKRATADGKDPSIEYHYAVALVRSGATDEGRKRLTALLARSNDFPEKAAARTLLDSTAGK